MKLLFACEQRFIKDNENNYYTDNPTFGDKLWERYLQAFEQIIVFARVKQNSTPTANHFKIENSHVSFIDVPYYVGPLQYLKVKSEIDKLAQSVVSPDYAYICRLPGQIGHILAQGLYKQQIPYAVEVVGDPWDVFAPGAIKHPLAWFFRITGYYKLRKAVYRSSAALYVTRYQLQKRYPVKKDTFTTSASDVILNDNLLTSPKCVDLGQEIKLTSIGSLEQMYKSPDITIQAVALLNKKGINCRLTWLGDGKYKEPMINLAKKLGVENQVAFLGNVSSEQVFQELKESDIYLHISRTEGLPRAVVEAMAVGLPCIGSRVGGIPELLEDIALIQKITPIETASKVEELCNNIQLMQQQAERNFNEALSYKESILSIKRILFYKTIINR